MPNYLWKLFLFLPECCSIIHIQENSKFHELDDPLNYFGSINLYLKSKKFNKRSKWCGVNKTDRRFCLEFFSGKWVIRHIVTDGEFDDEIYYSSSDAECPTGISDVSDWQKLCSIPEKWVRPSINDVTHLGGGGSAKRRHCFYLVKLVTWGREG